MCGIAGFVDNMKVINDKDEVIKAMAASLKERGPDDEGIYDSDYITLIHRRLAVVDIENGKQPMIEECNGEKYVLVYNGELYNADEIRKKMVLEGVKFKTKSDTEVVLKAFIKYNEKSLNMFNGIFAFAIYMEKSKKLFLARDKMGVKPLFYYFKNRTLIFASQIRTMLLANVIKRQIDDEGLKQLFMLGPGRVHGSGIIKDVFELKRGHYLVYQNNSIDVKKYWDVEAKKNNDTLTELIEKTRYLVEDSIRRQLISDIPLATFLSGGLDSSIISKIASDYFKEKNIKLTTFSINYIDNDKYFKKSIFQPDSDEEYIEIMKNYISSNHKNVCLDNQNVADVLGESCFMRDLPGMADIDSSLLLFCKEIKKDYSVALSGECADELFGGYPWYYNKEILYNEAFPWSTDLSIRDFVLKQGLIQNGREYVAEKYQEEIKNVSYLEDDTPEEKRMREMFMLNINWFMQTLLERKDKMTMASGLEVRVPFCDDRIVDLAYNMPWKYKYLNQREKGILRKAFEDKLPEKIIKRKKSPYPKTFNPIYMKAVSEKLLKILNAPKSRINELVNKENLIELINNPNVVKVPWYGQLMRTPQIFAYLIQVEYWLEVFNIDVVC